MQESANGDVYLLPMNNKIFQYKRTGHRNGSVRWAAAALIAVVAFFTSIPAHGQIGAQLVTSYAQATQTDSYPLPSATYSNNVLYICFTNTVQTSGTAPTVTGVSGAGLTFTEIGSAGGLTWGNTGLTSRRVQAWRALATSGATTGVVTISLDGDSAAMGAAIIEFTGTKTSGTNGADAVVQYNTSADDVSSLNRQVTLAAFADSNNRPVAFFSHRADEETANESGYTELYDDHHGSTVMGYEVEWHPTAEETTPYAEWTTSQRSAGFALEIAEGSGSTTVEAWVSQGTDDAEEDLVGTPGSMYLTSSDLELITDGDDQEVGIRFANITVPQGATITNAYVEFTVDESTGGDIALTIYGEDIDNAPTFTSSNGNITNRTKTSASVDWTPTDDWTPAGAKRQSPDISSIIQEIVDLGSWSSGNAMAIIVARKSGDSGTGHRTAESYEGATGHSDPTLAA
jgi:hypothetical protein